MDSEFAPSGPVLDLESALTRLGGDRELFAELVAFYCEDAPILLREVSSAVESKDAATVRMKAHALKGLVAGCGGVRATCIAQSLENVGQSGNLSKAPALVTLLKSELDELTLALAQHRS
jgi:two-component system, sensor histidine kinase and response regulator